MPTALAGLLWLAAFALAPWHAAVALNCSELSQMLATLKSSIQASLPCAMSGLRGVYWLAHGLLTASQCNGTDSLDRTCIIQNALVWRSKLYLVAAGSAGLR